MPENALTRIAPEVLTTSNPKSTLLLGARTLAQQDPKLSVIFKTAKKGELGCREIDSRTGGAPPAMLETEDPQEAWQVARYLADEYTQIGDSMLLISRETGRAIGRFTDEDLWQPDPVPREGGGMAIPLPRLRPELEAFMVMWHFNQGHEENLLKEITPRLHQTDLLKETGITGSFLSPEQGGRNWSINSTDSSPGCSS